MIHTEIILQGNGSERLSRRFYLHPLFRLDGLMQPVRITTAFHDTACLLVDDLHLPVDDYVFVVFLEKRVGFQQLVDCVHAFALDRVIR